MNRRNIAVTIMQASVVLIMSLGAGYMFGGHDIQAVIEVFAGLAILGCVSIIVPKFNPVFFLIPAILFCSPEFLNHNVVDIGIREFQGIGAGGLPVYTRIDPVTSLPVGITIGLLEITGGIALSYLHSLQNDYITMKSAKYEPGDVEYTTRKNFSVIFLLIGAGLVVSVILAMILTRAQDSLSRLFTGASSDIFVFGLIAIIVLSAFIYYLINSTYRKKSDGRAK